MRHFIIGPLSLLALLPPVGLLAAQQGPADSACPAPSVQDGGPCVLRQDAILSDTMWLRSGTTLNCRGHRLTAVNPGVLDQPRTPANEFQPSQPELALFVHRSYGVTIQNCVIAGFDFGITVAQSKAADAPRILRDTNIRILDNTIDVRTNAIDVIKSDGVIISDNSLSYASERGRGVVTRIRQRQQRDRPQHDYQHRCRLYRPGAPGTGGPLVTQPAIMDNEIHTLQMNQPVRNLVVSGILTQIAASDPSPDNGDSTTRPDHNVIEANDITDLGPGPSCTLDPDTSCQADVDCSATGKGVCLLKQNNGIAFNIRAADTIVRGNRVSGRMNRGVSFAGLSTAFLVVGWFPGTCARDSGRICSSDADCSIPGYDVRSIGPCDNEADLTLNGNTMRLTAEDNLVSGEYDSAALFAGETNQFIFRGNTVEGGVSGIRINAPAINGLIERNVVSGSANALYLAFPPTFTHAIRLNDFTGYSAAIRTSNNFTVATDISTDMGNYWGLSCPGFDRRRVLFDNGAVNPHVTDGKPYGVPVARTSAESLPRPCL